MKCVRKKMCNDCPWRRESMAGWLGNEAPEPFVARAHSEQAYPCHVEVDYTDPEWEATLELDDTGPHQCAGLAVFRSNVGKLPRDPEVQVLPSDRENVFSSNAEFINHHRSSPFGFESWEEESA